MPTNERRSGGSDGRTATDPDEPLSNGCLVAAVLGAVLVAPVLVASCLAAIFLPVNAVVPIVIGAGVLAYGLGFPAPPTPVAKLYIIEGAAAIVVGLLAAIGGLVVLWSSRPQTPPAPPPPKVMTQPDFEHATESLYDYLEIAVVHPDPDELARHLPAHMTRRELDACWSDRTPDTAVVKSITHLGVMAYDGVFDFEAAFHADSSGVDVEVVRLRIRADGDWELVSTSSAPGGTPCFKTLPPTSRLRPG